MVFSRSKRKFTEYHDQLKEITDENFNTYMNRFMYNNLDRFCLSQTPPLFAGPSISSSPLEKINDLLKQHVTNSSHPRFIVNKAEFLTKKTLKYCVAFEKSKLPEVHKDYRLINVQRHVSAKIFKLFYANYIEAASVYWT